MTAVAKAKERNASPIENAFAGRSDPPTEKTLAEALGPTLPLWKGLVADLREALKIDLVEWHSTSAKYGWSLRLQLKKRNIVYLGPRQGWFVAAFALGDRAVAVARKSDLPQEVIQNINTSKRYAEGTAVRIDVKTPADVEVVKILSKIKIEN